MCYSSNTVFSSDVTCKQTDKSDMKSKRYTPDYPYNELPGKGKNDSLYPGFVIQNIIDQIFLQITEALTNILKSVIML